MLVGCCCFDVAPRSVSPALDKIKDPGSPTNGVSSMNSSPYRARRLNDSARVIISLTVELVSVCVPVKDCVLFVASSGIGVFSLLVCVCTPSWPASVDLGAGGRYVCPCDGVKLGNVDAVFIKLDREVTAESYNEDAMLVLPTLNK